MTTLHLEKPIALPISPEELERINEHLSGLAPEDILRWAVDHLPGLFQTTAFGLTGLVAIDMLSKITREPPPLIFIDTLYHFTETYELVEEVKKKYGVPVNAYKPEGCADVQVFEQRYGKELWKSDETAYDYYVKVNADPFLVGPR
jgi:phosphoadenosine phosphosulfate reductase